MSAASYPVRLEGRLDARLSRWLWLVKWVLVIPHLVVLAFLWAAFVVLSLVAFVAVAATGRYPRSIFDFNLGVLRWTWRVAFYAYGALGTDRYPPFTLADVPEHPARLEIPYPEHLPHGFALVRWWIIALPHYVLAIVLVGGVQLLTPLQGGALTLLALIAGVALAVTGRYPRQLFDLILGLNRWVVRAAAYAALMTDAYPPLRLDTGDEPVGTITMPAPAPRAGGSRTGLIVTGAVAALIGLGLLAGGAGLVAVDLWGRDASGYVTTPWQRYATPTYAIVAAPDQLDLRSVAGVTPADMLGTVRLTARSDRPVFVGVARADDVRSYLGDVERTALSRIGGSHPVERVVPGAAPAHPPGHEGIWAASAGGAGARALTWRPRTGDWRVVVMNADAARGVVSTLRAGARLPHLGTFAVGVLAGGLLTSALAAGLLAAGLRRRDGDA